MRKWLPLVEPKAESVGEDTFGGFSGGHSFAEKPVQVIEGQSDFQGAQHFFFDPCGDAAVACFALFGFPLDDGPSGATEFLGEFFAGEIPIESKFSEYLGCHDEVSLFTF